MNNNPQSAIRNPQSVESHLRVRYAETDSMGIVYHANYLIWMEIGRTDYFRALGFSYRDLEREYKLFTPVVEVQCRYLAPACYDDDVVVRTRVTQVNRRLIRFGYEVWRTTDACLLAEGESAHLVIDSERRRTSFPEVLLTALRDRGQGSGVRGQGSGIRDQGSEIRRPGDETLRKFLLTPDP